jgi:large subunit ribosomal protein L15
MVAKGLLKNTKTDVKILGEGELTKKLAVTAHSFSASAREKIEGAGGSVTALKEPKVRKPKRARVKPAAAEATEPEEASAEPDAEAETPEAE